ncbi:MAG TPA: enolase C-terminal domain-like protein [Microlunatus sp.]|nr:enolase C-terminal domain-like protein [Microlunatus sp.]
MSRFLDATVAEIRTVPVSPRVKPELLVSGARGTHDRSDFLLVEITTSAGVSGIGEVSATLTWSGEDSTTAQHVIDAVLRPALIGRPLTPVAELEAAMDRVLAGHPFTKAGISIALWDAYARTLDVPLAVALGGPRRTEVPVKCSLSGNGERLRTGLEHARAAGFGAYKIKIGMDLSTDVARMRELRELVGPDVLIGLDANGGYSRTAARRAGRLLLPYDPLFYEQPVAPGDLAGMAQLRDLGLPVVADESVFDTDDLMAVLAAGAADVISLYVGKSGGPGRAVAMGRIAAAAGLDVIIGSNGELGVGAAAQPHVACALDRLSEDIPSDIIGAHYYTGDILAGGLDATGARACLGDGPGLGVALTEELAAAFR